MTDASERSQGPLTEATSEQPGVRSSAGSRWPLSNATRVALGGVAVVAVLVIGFLTLSSDDEVVPPSSRGPSVWSTLPEAPLSARQNSAIASRGSQITIWGGSVRADGDHTVGGGNVGGLAVDGATYDLATGKWTALAAPASTGREMAGAVWTDDELVIWGGLTDSEDESGTTPGEAFDPDTGTWRTLPLAPFRDRVHPDLFWTGTEVLVVGGRSVAATGPATVGAWNPSTGAWRVAAQLPATFDGMTAALAGDAIVAVGGTDPSASGVVLEATGAEAGTVRRRLPPLPPGAAPALESIAVIDGRVLHVAGVVRAENGDRLVAASRDLDDPTPAWTLSSSTEARGLPFERGVLPAAAVVDHHLVLWGAWWRTGVSLDLAAGAWEDLPPPRGAPRGESVSVAVDGRLFIWGGEASGVEGGTDPELLADGFVLEGVPD